MEASAPDKSDLGFPFGDPTVNTGMGTVAAHMGVDEETRTLVLAAKDGDLAAYGLLYDRLAPCAQRFVCSLGLNLAQGEVEDVIQDTFLRLHGALPTFDVERRLEPFVLGIARRTALELRRRKKPVVEPRDTAAPGKTTSERLVRRETDELIRDAMAALTPDDQAALALRHTNRLTLRELATSLACSVPTARARLRLAAERFARELRARGIVTAQEAS